MSEAGALTLVGTPIGNLDDLSPRAVDALRAADVVAAEDTRRTRALLTHLGIPAGGRLRSVRAANEREAASLLVQQMAEGADVAYVTDAGMPAISDPGEHLVRAALDAGLAVQCVPGPSAPLVALALSGFSTRRFVFEGFLPRKGRARGDRLDALATEQRTAVLFESPRRVAVTLAELAQTCGAERRVAVARELTKRFEHVWRGSLAEASDAVGDDPRGEFVIVIDGAAPRGPIADAEVAAAVDLALGGGMSPRDAASEVSRTLGVARRRAYQIAINRRQS